MNPYTHQSILANAPFGYAYHQLIVDEHGKPVDYVFLEVNAMFEEITGLKANAIIGKKLTEVLPGILNADFDWIGFYGKVALNGGEDSLVDSLGR